MTNRKGCFIIGTAFFQLNIMTGADCDFHRLISLLKPFFTAFEYIIL